MGNLKDQALSDATLALRQDYGRIADRYNERYADAYQRFNDALQDLDEACATAGIEMREVRDGLIQVREDVWKMLGPVGRGPRRQWLNLCFKQVNEAVSFVEDALEQLDNRGNDETLAMMLEQDEGRLETADEDGGAFDLPLPPQRELPPREDRLINLQARAYARYQSLQRMIHEGAQEREVGLQKVRFYMHLYFKLTEAISMDSIGRVLEAY